MPITETPTIYLDDPDPTWTATLRSTDGTTTIDWVSPLVAIDNGSYTVNGTFLGSPATTRQIRIPLSGLQAGSHNVYLKVPNGTDLELGRIVVKART